MAEQVFPTKGNLIATKKSLALSSLGYELLDRKRNILVREMMQLIDKANTLGEQIDNAYTEAYRSLQFANLDMGIVDNDAQAVPIYTGLGIRSRSVMGVEIPNITLEPITLEPHYGLYHTSSQLDDAYGAFSNLLQLTATLAEVENSVYRLAQAIKKTQRRANSLKNIIIPRFMQTAKYISDYLEEKEREEFSRLKLIKHKSTQGE
ncbi:MAG: V-type ATP synthase subunit D [Acetanaerobacterium sp.]